MSCGTGFVSAFCILLVAAFSCFVVGSNCLAKEQLPPGVVSQRPASGSCVENNGVFLVPYSQSIPGTKIAFDMVPVPGGEFVMGSPDSEADRKDDEGPQVKVKLAPFWMAKYEVTWEEYHEFMRLYDLFKKLESQGVRTVDDTNRVDAITVPTPLYEPSYTYASDDPPDAQQPAVTMSQYAAKQYTKWLSGITGQPFRLPTEAEWEYACRAGSTSAYGFGDDASELEAHAWYFDNSDDFTHKVGEKKPNAWGLYDMHGNVGELVLDQYSAEHYDELSQQRQPLQGLAAVKWPSEILSRVIRGGSWQDDADRLRSAARHATADWRLEDPNLPKSPWWFTDEESLGVGFRVIRSLHPIAESERNRIWEPDAERLQAAVDDRIEEGRGVYGLVDTELPAVLEKIK